MPAETASLRSAYSWALIEVTAKTGIRVPSGALCAPPPRERGGRPIDAPSSAVLLVRGKLSHRCCDFGRVGHHEFLLWRVERHCGYVSRGDPYHRSVQVVERVLG